MILGLTTKVHPIDALSPQMTRRVRTSRARDASVATRKKQTLIATHPLKELIMNSKFFIAASLALVAAHGAALAETSPSYAERMRLIGRSPVPAEQAQLLPSSDSGKLQTAAELRAQHAARMGLIGRTVGYGETSAVTLHSDTVAGNAQQQFEQRMKLIGRTVQQGELAGYNVESVPTLSAQRATRKVQ